MKRYYHELSFRRASAVRDLDKLDKAEKVFYGKQYPFIVVFETDGQGTTKAYEFFSKTEFRVRQYEIDLPGTKFSFITQTHGYSNDWKQNTVLLSSAATLEKVGPFLDDSENVAKIFEEFIRILRAEFQAEKERESRKISYQQNVERNATDQLNSILGEIEQQQPSQKTNQTSHSSTSQNGGCYVATAVYGSYDCAEVWTLRRFRDIFLSRSMMGRAFIKMYYAISPTLVKWLGDTKWFKSFWKHYLDKLVKQLNRKGYANTPYKD